MTTRPPSVETTAPTPRGGLHRQVVEQIAMQIIRGDYPAGSFLPVEADLCDILGVGRSSVREAMRVLTDKGLVEVRTRSGARVLDRRAWRRLDPDMVRWTLERGVDLEFLADLLEARRIFEPAAAALASKRATGADLASIETALVAMEAGLSRGGKRSDLETCVDADIAFHRAILAGTGNAILEEFEAIINAALRAAFTLSTKQARAYGPSITAHREVYEAIRLRDAEHARAAMDDLLRVASEDLRLG